MRHQIFAVSAFIPHQGEALIVQRAADESFLPDHWEQVGGKVEWGERPYDGLIREVREEAGLTVEPVQVYWLLDYAPASERHIIEAAIICRLSGEPAVRLSSEHRAYRWVTAEEVRDVAPMTDAMRESILAGFAFWQKWT